MKKTPNQSMNKIVFCTFADIKSANSGDGVNDRNLYNAIPKNYNKIPIYPKYNSNNKISIFSTIKFFRDYLIEIIKTNNVFITRALKLAILPILLRNFFKNKVVVRMGCTPFSYLERQAFRKNIEFRPTNNFLKKFYYLIEPYLEFYVLRHVDKFIVENKKAKKIVISFGVKSSDVKIIPYYVEDFFSTSINPNYDKNSEFLKIGYTGRFKSYDTLNPVINTIALMKEKNFKILLYLIGDGPNRRFIENMVIKKGLSQNVIFLGSKSHQEVAKLIEDYHCLLLPMYNNLFISTIPIKILEGILKGKIVITTDSGNIISLFLENTDLILKNATKDNIMHKIELIVENYEKYRDIAENLSKYHSIKRSHHKIETKISNLLHEVNN
jgi:glycosyltransferase involved in cell wall biosynthesis